ncbi:hypothetical protein L596_016124 [Steinernema carpocapsae]|uniref:PRORP domain-containing protein n=1 Tax=Steinernema carpocapsae TaxID=34508 RepID=A0A4U5NI97_STECR|nr:hypothetical protein L596_016124 [Steinernema carpocapsae]
MFALNTSSGSTSSTATRTSSLAKASTSPTRSTMLLPRLRSNFILIGLCSRATFLSYTTGAKFQRKFDQKVKHGQQKVEKKWTKVVKRDVSGKQFTFDRVDEFQVLDQFGLKDEQDKGLGLEVLNSYTGGLHYDTRVLEALRKCSQFEASRDFMKHILKLRTKLAPPALLEAVRVFPAMALKDNVNPEIDRELITSLQTQTATLPESVFSETIRLFIEVAKSSQSGFVDLVNLDSFKFSDLLFERECFSALAYEAISARDVQRFLRVTELYSRFANNELRSSKRLNAAFCDFVKFSDLSDCTKLQEFYFGGLCGKNVRLNPREFKTQMEPLLPILEKHGWKIRSTEVGRKKGDCSACGSNLKLDNELLEEEFKTLKDSFTAMMETMAEGFQGGSQKEMDRLDKLLQRQSSEDKTAPWLVMDLLNVAHNHWNNFHRVHQMILNLLQDFHRVVVVTRHLRDPTILTKLRNLPVDIFTCDHRSEDDLFVLLTTMSTGPNCFVMTNDFYGLHRSRLEPEVAPLFDRWMSRRCVRFDRARLHYQVCSAVFRERPNLRFGLSRAGGGGRRPKDPHV